MLMRQLSSTFSNDQQPIVFAPSLLFDSTVNDLTTYMASSTSFYSVDYSGLSSPLVNGTTANSILAAYSKGDYAAYFKRMNASNATFNVD
mmetsp:Transcript_49644/g.41866  ORF Transcript_49644/g.41866 Transcript_49644/m.41866 type:complete len:90 (-) Transcript_49644:1540-1809(-)